MTLLSRQDRIFGLSIAAAALVGCLLAGCSALTIAPKPIEVKVASYSGNEPNGGFIGFLAPGSPAPGAITAAAEARYEALIRGGYAKTFTVMNPGPRDGLAPLPDGPAVVFDHNLPHPATFKGAWSIDDEHLTLFGQMARAFAGGFRP